MEHIMIISSSRKEEIKISLIRLAKFNKTLYTNSITFFGILNGKCLVNSVEHLLNFNL